MTYVDISLRGYRNYKFPFYYLTYCNYVVFRNGDKVKYDVNLKNLLFMDVVFYE